VACLHVARSQAAQVEGVKNDDHLPSWVALTPLFSSSTVAPAVRSKREGAFAPEPVGTQAPGNLHPTDLSDAGTNRWGSRAGSHRTRGAKPLSRPQTATVQPPRQPVTLADYQTLARFRRALRAFLHFSDEAARAAGLTPAQHQLMLAVKGAESGQQRRSPRSPIR
jgi:hypothetical protein